MGCCAYCRKPATVKILSSPDAVCVDHAVEFWSGLLVFAHDRAGPCTRDEQVCSCRLCQEMSEASLRALAIAAAGAASPEHARFEMRLAS